MVTRPGFTLSLIALAALMATSCGEFRYHATKNQCANGSHGNPDRNSPLVCVAELNGAAVPLIEPVHVYPQDVHGNHTMIHWKTSTDGVDLQVTMSEGQSCVTKVNCDARGNNCVAFVDPKAAPGTSCSYSVTIAGETRPKDPIIIIDSCCAEAMPAP